MTKELLIRLHKDMIQKWINDHQIIEYENAYVSMDDDEISVLFMFDAEKNIWSKFVSDWDGNLIRIENDTNSTFNFNEN